jgi:hypothetical protein
VITDLFTNADDYSYESALYLSTRKKRQLNLFWVGFFIYSLSFTLPLSSVWSYTIENIFQLIGLFLLSVPTLSLTKFKFDNHYLKFFFLLFCIWTFITLLRGGHFLLDRNYQTPFLFDPFEGLLYFVPVLLLFPRTFQCYRKLFDIIVFFGIAYLIISVIFIKGLINPDVSNRESQSLVEDFSLLSFPCGFILMTIIYHPKKRKLFALFVTFLALMFTVFRARRGLTFMFANMIVFAFILYVFRSKAKLLIMVFTIFVGLIAALFLMDSKLSNVGLLRNFTQRLNEDTRSYVVQAYYDDMKPMDWAIGKGLNGMYYCPGVEENEIYRKLSETGYLTTILKGGLVSIGLFLLIAIPAMIKGLFLSKNLFSKAAAIWILMSMIDSYPGTTTGFTLSYLMVWISVGICYSKEIRNMSDDTIRNFLYPEYNSNNDD